MNWCSNFLSMKMQNFGGFGGYKGGIPRILKCFAKHFLCGGYPETKLRTLRSDVMLIFFSFFQMEMS